MSLERENIPQKQVQLLYPSIDLSLSVQVSSLIGKLQSNDLLYSQNENVIIGQHKKPAKRLHIPSQKSVDVTEVNYSVFDAKNGLENFAARGIIVKDHLIIEQGTIFEYATYNAQDPLKRPYIDTARTTIKRKTNEPMWEGVSIISRNEYDDLAVIRKTETLFTLPSEKILDQEMRSITDQISILGKTEGYKVSLKSFKKNTPKNR